MFNKRNTKPPKWRRWLMAGAGSLGVAALAITGMTPAYAHTGDLGVTVDCVNGEYVPTYTLTLSNVPDGVTATVEARTGGASFEAGWNYDSFGDWVVKEAGVPSTQNTVSWTAAPIPGNTVGNGPWEYSITSFSNGVSVQSDTRVEGLAGDCATTPQIITASYTTEVLSCDANSRNWLHLDAALGGIWTISSTLHGSSPLAIGVGYDGDQPNGPTGYVEYTVSLADGDPNDGYAVTPASFTWTPVDPNSLDCPDWQVCTAQGATTTSYDMAGWPVTDIRFTGDGDINDDQPRSGFGSLMLYTPANADKVQYIQPVDAFPLDDLIQMEYETFLTTPGVAMGSLQLQIISESKGLAAADKAFIVYEVYVDQGNAAIVLNTWQHWDAYRGGDAKVWSNKGAVLGIAPQGAPATFKAILEEVPDIQVIGYVINQGSGNPGTLSYVDNVGFAKKGESCGIENFEPAPTVVPADPNGSVAGVCLEEPDTGAEARVAFNNPAPTEPNTVAASADGDVKLDGDTTPYHTLTAASGDSLTYVVPLAEDSGGGTRLVELYYGETLLGSAIIDTNCADDLIVDPVEIKPNPPTCDADGSLPDVPGGDHYTVDVSPSGTGPGKYTVTATADSGYVFAGGDTYVYTITVLPKVVTGCGGLASTNGMLLMGGIGGGTFGLSLLALGVLGLWWNLRRKPTQA